MLRSEKLQRLTAVSVSALLAANALVLVVGLGDDLGDDLPDDDPAAEQPEPETVTFIVREDGTRVAVDPSTPDGSRAIADARERGQEVVSVEQPMPDPTTETTRKPTTTTSTTTTTTRPRSSTSVAPAGSAITLPDVEGLVDDTLTTVVTVLEQVTDTVDDTVDRVTDVVDDTTGLDTGGTVDPIVDQVTDVVDETLGGVVDAITQQTLPPVTVPDLLGGLGP